VVTYTDNKKLNKPANGEFPDTWDVPVNEDWDIIDKALGGAATFTVAGTDITLTISDAQNQRIVLTGTPGASRNIIIPFRFLSSTTAVGGMWIVDNQTNANQNILTEVSGSNGVTVIAGRRALVYSDGTDVKFADDVRLISGTGISVSGSTVSLSVPVSVANGGTGLTTLTTGNVILGNGTSEPTFVAPGTVGNVLTSNGSSWISSAPTGGSGTGITSISFATASGMGFSFTPNTITTSGSTTTLSGTLAVANGGTGAVSLTGLLRGNGTGAVSGSALVNLASEVTGTLAVANGGTGTTTSTGTGAIVRATSPSISAASFTGATTATQFTSGNGTAATTSPNRFHSSSDWALAAVSSSGTGGMYVRSISGTPLIGWYNGTSNIANIVNNGTSVSYNTSSDYRLKENVANYVSGLSAVNALRPVTYKWKSDPNGPTATGFIAHEVQAIVPQAVNGVKDAVDKNGNIIPQGIDTSFLVPHLVSAVQELSKKIDQLEARIAVLEAK